MATVPAPWTWLPGEIPTASQFNTQIRDAVNFYKQPPAVIVKHGSNVTISPETWTLLTWTDADVVDTDGMHSTSTDPSRIIAVTAGWYFFFAHIRWAEHADNVGGRGVHVRRNAGGAIGGGYNTGGVSFKHSNNVAADRHGQSLTGYVAMSANDYLECFVWHDQTNLIATPIDSIIYHVDSQGTTPTRFGMIWMGT